MVAAALRLATLAHVEKERHEQFPVIVDDVDAELDSTALTRLVDHLETNDKFFSQARTMGSRPYLVLEPVECGSIMEP